MANWSDPRTGAASYATQAGTRDAAYDAGLRSYMLSVYNYMLAGVLLTGIVSMGFAASGWAYQIFAAGGALAWILVLSPLAIIFAMSFGAARMSRGTLQALFFAYAGLIGLSISTIFLRYTGTDIAAAFFATAAGFAGLSLWGYTTKKDLTAFGTFMTIGLFGLIVALLLNLWFQSSQFSLVISALGVLIFAGLTAYDTQRIKSEYAVVVGTPWEGKAAIMGALNLYLDFINMFLFLLRLFGSSRN